jgi:ABC-type Co2+ transport system permease subunit
MKQFWCVRVARCVREFSGVQALGVGRSWVTLVLANCCSGGLCAADFVWVSISGFEVWHCVYWAAEFFCNF